MTLFPEADNWRAAMQDVSAAIDETMGEPVVVTPTRSGGVNMPRIPYPQKAVTVTGVFTSIPTDVALGGGKKMIGAHDVYPVISTRKPVFQFALHAFPFPLEQGHLITLLRTGEVFQVTDVKSDGVARLTVQVNEIGPERDDTGPRSKLTSEVVTVGVGPTQQPQLAVKRTRVPPVRW